jgi:putative membrane protein
MQRHEDTILRSASFDKPSIQRYWMISGIILSCVTIIGIPFMAIWVPIMLYFSGRIIDRMEATLTPTKLVIRKGWLVRIEKVLPLEKITDLGLVQGPIMRALNLTSITVETAGSSGAGQSLVKLIGVIDTEGFRTAVLEQRDAVSEGKANRTSARESTTPGSGETLERISGTLERIEKLLAERRERP